MMLPSRTFLTAALLSLVPLAVLVVADTRPDTRSDAHFSPAASGRPALPAAGSYSIYELGSAWHDQQGRRLTLDSLRGRPRLLAMIYTHCSSTCPLALAEMKRIEGATDPRLGLVLVSLDPDRDTPRVLATYAASHGLDPSRWTLLAGSDADVRELAASLGVRYRRLGPDELAHSNTLTLLDHSGHVVHQQQGLDEHDETIRAARALLK